MNTGDDKWPMIDDILTLQVIKVYKVSDSCGLFIAYGNLHQTFVMPPLAPIMKLQNLTAHNWQN